MPRPRKLTTVVATGDHRASLEALRDRLALEIEVGQCCKACGGPVTSQTAPLAKQLADVLKALAAIPTGKEATLDDELARRRNTGRAPAGVPVRPQGRSQRKSRVGGRSASGSGGAEA